MSIPIIPSQWTNNGKNLAVVPLKVNILVVLDETSDVEALLDQINGQPGQVDVAGFRFDATIKVER